MPLKEDAKTELAGFVIKSVRHKCNMRAGEPSDPSLVLTLAAVSEHVGYCYHNGLTLDAAQREFLEAIKNIYGPIWERLAKEIRSRSQ